MVGCAPQHQPQEHDESAQQQAKAVVLGDTGHHPASVDELPKERALAPARVHLFCRRYEWMMTQHWYERTGSHVMLLGMPMRAHGNEHTVSHVLLMGMPMRAHGNERTVTWSVH